MGSIKDNRGYNQGFKPSEALKVRMERRGKYMISKMNCSKDTRILEIGCGTGEISYFLAKKTGCQVLGTDLCADFVKGAHKEFSLNNLKYEILDFNNPESIKRVVGETKFDYIVGNGILHHLFYQIDSALGNIHSLLGDKGKLIFLEPNILNPYCFLIFKSPFFRKLANLEPGEMAFTKNFIKSKLRKAGYKSIEIEYKDFLIPGTPKPLIKSLIKIGNILEKMPPLNRLAQSIYITATKQQK